MDSRIALAPDTQLRFTNKQGGKEQYTVAKEIGRGGSSIVYDATYETNPGDIKHIRLKECYPFKLRVRRNADGFLCAEQGDADAFKKAQERFAADFSLGNGLFYSDDLFDALTSTIDIYSGNGTVYLASAYSPESTLATYNPGSLKKCISLVKQVAYVVGKIHKAGYLYLDIKPENVLVIEGFSTRIQLFDFDSLFPIRDRSQASQAMYKAVKLSYSKGFAPVELQTAKMNKLGPHTDIYSIGALLYYLLFGKTPEAADCEENAAYDYSVMKYRQESFHDKLFFSLTAFFHRTLANFYLDRYPEMEQVIAELDRIEHFSDETEIYIRSTPIHAPENIVGRCEEISALSNWLRNDERRVTFVTGMGGIGKSTLVRALICREQKYLDQHVLYLPYRGSIEYTLADDDLAPINTIEKDDNESLSEYFVRKLKAFRKAVEGTNFLLVIDNFDAHDIGALRQVISVGWKVILISRSAPLTNIYPILHVSALKDQKALRALFASYLTREIAAQDMLYIDNIINKAAGHTYLIELIAKQIASSHISIQQASNIVDEYGFTAVGSEKIVASQDDAASLDTIKNILTALHKTEGMSECEYGILKVAALFDDAGVDINLFHEILSLESKDDVNSLIRDGWVQSAEDRIIIHPLMRETVHCWAWNDSALASAETLMVYVYREIKVEAHKEDYPLKLIQLMDFSMKQYAKHPWLKKAFDWYTARNKTIGAVVKERYERHENSETSGVTDHAKVTQYVRMAEGILHNCKREPALLNMEIYCDLLYSTVLNMPRYYEEFILKGATELIQHPLARNGFTLMKLYDCVMSVYQERRDYQNASRTIKEAEATARRFGHHQVMAQYYNLLSDYYDALLNGAYKSDNFEEIALLQNMLSAIDKTIRHAKRSRMADSKQLLAKNLLAKATVLIRIPDSEPTEIKKLLAEAKHLVDTESQEFSELRGHFYMVMAWYCAIIEGNAETAGDCMVVARYISKQNAATDLDDIDNAIVPCADVYRNLEDYAQAAKLLMDAIAVCEENPTKVPYIRKKMELYQHLLDVCFEWEKIEICRAVIDEIEAENCKNQQYGIWVDIHDDIRNAVLAQPT